MSSTIVPNVGDTQGTTVRASVEGPDSSHGINAHAQALVNAVKDHIPGNTSVVAASNEASPAQQPPQSQPKASADAYMAAAAAEKGHESVTAAPDASAAANVEALEKDKKESDKSKSKEAKIEAKRREKEAKLKAKEDARRQKMEAKKNKDQNALLTLLAKQNNAKAESEAKRHKLEDKIKALEGKAAASEKKAGAPSKAPEIAAAAAPAVAAPAAVKAVTAPTSGSVARVDKSTLSFMSDQVAGHEAGVYTVGDGALAVKSGLPAEAEFYNSILIQQSQDISKSQRALLKKLSQYLPTYHGSLDIVDGQGATTRAVVLENLTHGYKHASVLDIKLGKQLWDEGASADKRARMDETSKNTTSGKTGVRLTGWQAWDSETDKFVKVDKTFGKSIGVDQLEAGVRSFFGLASEEDAKIVSQYAKSNIAPVFTPYKAVERIVSEAVIPALKEIYDIVKKLEWRVRGASLLIIYEGDAETLQAAAKKSFPRCGRSADQTDRVVDPSQFGTYKSVNTTPRLVDVRLIDFAHATITPGKGHDAGFLAGISTTRDLVEKLAKDARKGKIGGKKHTSVKDTVNEAIVSAVIATDIAASRKSDVGHTVDLSAESNLTTAPIVAAAAQRSAEGSAVVQQKEVEPIAARPESTEQSRGAAPVLTTAPIVAAAAVKAADERNEKQDESKKAVPARPAKAEARESFKVAEGDKAGESEKSGLLATIFGRRKSHHKVKEETPNVKDPAVADKAPLSNSAQAEQPQKSSGLSSTEEAGVGALAGVGATVGAGAILLASDSNDDKAKTAEADVAHAKAAEEKAVQEKAAAEERAADEHRAAEESRLAKEKAVAASKAAEMKAASEHEAAQASKAAEEKALAEKKALEEKLKAEHEAAEESKRALLAKEEAEKKAAEERHTLEVAAVAERVAAEKKAADERKLAEERLEEEKRRAAEEKAALEKRLAEERQLADKKIAEEHKAAEEKLAEQRKEAEQKIAAEKKRAEEEKAALEKKIAEETKRAEEEKAALEKKTAEEKKTAAAVAAAELKAAQDAKKDELKHAEEEKVALEKKTAEEKKTAAALAAAELKSAQDAKKEEKKRAAEEKAALEKKNAEERKTAAAVAAAELKAAQDAKKEAQKLQQQQAKDAKKAEQEARRLKEDLAKQKKKAEKEARKDGKSDKRKSRFSTLFATPILHSTEPSNVSTKQEKEPTAKRAVRSDNVSFSGAPAGGALSTLAPQEVEDQRLEAERKKEGGVSALFSPLLKRNDSDAHSAGPSFSTSPAGAEETQQSTSKGGLERKISEKVHHGGGLFGLSSKKNGENEDTGSNKEVVPKKHDGEKEAAAVIGGAAIVGATTAAVVSKEEEKPQTPAKDEPASKEGEGGFFGGLVRRRTQKSGKEAPQPPSKDEKAIHADAVKAHQAAQQAKAEAEKARAEAKRARDEAERAHAEVLKVQSERAKALKEKEEVEKAHRDDLKRNQSQKRKSGLALFGLGSRKTDEGTAKDLPVAPAKDGQPDVKAVTANVNGSSNTAQTQHNPLASKKSSVDGHHGLESQIAPEILAAIVTDDDRDADKNRLSVDRASKKSVNESKTVAAPPVPAKEETVAKQESQSQRSEKPLGRIASIWHGKGGARNAGQEQSASKPSKQQPHAGAIVEEIVEETEKGTQKFIRVTNPPRGAGRAPSAVQWRDPK